VCGCSGFGFGLFWFREVLGLRGGHRRDEVVQDVRQRSLDCNELI
jgi:hypothetical protein